MSEYTKGYWVKHKKLVKKWDEYVEDIYWDCSICGYVPYEGADYSDRFMEDVLNCNVASVAKSDKYKV